MVVRWMAVVALVLSVAALATAQARSQVSGALEPRVGAWAIAAPDLAGALSHLRGTEARPAVQTEGEPSVDFLTSESELMERELAQDGTPTMVPEECVPAMVPEECLPTMIPEECMPAPVAEEGMPTTLPEGCPPPMVPEEGPPVEPTPTPVAPPVDPTPVPATVEPTPVPVVEPTAAPSPTAIEPTATPIVSIPMASPTGTPGLGTPTTGTPGPTGTPPTATATPGIGTTLPTPTPTIQRPGGGFVPEAPASGSWAGTTSQGRPITFTVQGTALTTISFGYSAPGCGGLTGQATTTYHTSSLPAPMIEGGRFAAVVVPGGSTSVGSVDGTFQGSASAQGVLRLTLFGPPEPGLPIPCVTSVEATWTAAPQ